MKMRIIMCVATALLFGGVKQLAAAERKNNNTEIAKIEKLAKAGDANAMSELGLRYHQGDGVPQDYVRAMDWYLQAIEQGDGDAYNNLGVLYRDGLGVTRNQKIAYLVFLAVHMEGLGDESTQARAGRNLERLAESLPKDEIYEALSYTWPYVVQLLKSRGKDRRIGADVLPAKDRPRIRDNGWWLDSERAAMTFASPAPWNLPERKVGKSEPPPNGR